MTTTTSYGTWCNHGDHSNVTVEASVLDFISGGDDEWRDLMESSGALGHVVDDYRDEINDALPEGVRLAGNEFYGPAYEKDFAWEGELDIAEIIEEIDLGEIVERHDPDNA